MRNYVIINGVNSLTIQGLAINNLPPITKPMIRTQREEIDGRDGDIVTELGYSAYDKSMEIGLYGNFDIDAIIKYFTGEGTIVFSNEEDKYYNFKILDQIDYEKLLKFKTAVVTFHCQPFKYPVEETPIEGETITITGSGSNITLENTIVAPMDMKLKGNTIQDGTPTPDSPIPVQVVSGDNSIEVVGKNLLNPNQASPSETSNMQFYRDTGLLLKANTTYCMSYYGADNVLGMYIKEYSTNVTLAVKYSNKVLTYTPTEDKYAWLDYYSPGIDKTISNFQLEVGSASTPYEEYKNASYPISLGIENLWNNDIQTFTNQSRMNKIIKNYNGVWMFEITQSDGYSFAHSTFTLPAGTYTVTADVDNGDFIILKGSATQTIPFTLTEETQLTFRVYKNGVVGDVITLSNVKIAKGTTTKGVVNNPIKLNKIGTYQDKIFKSSGKNLFNPYVEINTTFTNSIATALQNFKDTGKYAIGYLNRNANINNDNRYETIFIECQENTTYTLSFSTQKEISSLCYIDNNANVIGVGKDYWSTFSEFTFTTAQNSQFIVLGIKNIDIERMQLEKGIATSYEPYGTGWYLKKEIGKVVLNGSENWQLRTDVSTSTGFYTYQNLDYVAGVFNTNSIGFSNNFEIVTGVNNSKNNIRLVNSANYGTQICITGEIAQTAAQLKSWLSTHNTEVYYIRITPTYETITDTTLIGQLEALKPYSYNPTTNITQINDDAPFELDVSLSYTNTMNVNNVGNIYAKPILTIEGSGTIGIILNDIEVLSVDLGTDEKITIDVPNLQAYNPDNDVLLNRNVTGDYMKLLINDGDNTIAFSGSVTNATLTNYTRWI